MIGLRNTTKSVQLKTTLWSKEVERIGLLHPARRARAHSLIKGCDVSFTIPDVFLINYGSIDEEHRSLIKHVNGLLKTAQNGSSDNFERAFETLLDEFASHFEHEEILMAEADYDGLSGHKSHHDESLLALKELYASCQEKGIIVPEDVYVCFDHVIKDVAKADLKFAEFLDSSGKR